MTANTHTHTHKSIASALFIDIMLYNMIRQKCKAENMNSLYK